MPAQLERVWRAMLEVELAEERARFGLHRADRCEMEAGRNDRILEIIEAVDVGERGGGAVARGEALDGDPRVAPAAFAQGADHGLLERRRAAHDHGVGRIRRADLDPVGDAAVLRRVVDGQGASFRLGPGGHRGGERRGGGIAHRPMHGDLVRTVGRHLGDRRRYADPGRDEAQAPPRLGPTRALRQRQAERAVGLGVIVQPPREYAGGLALDDDLDTAVGRAAGDRVGPRDATIIDHALDIDEGARRVGDR